MKSVKHMTLDQVKRIQLNNYCSEHNSKGKQFDYEAKGYKDAIDARYWELIEKRVINQLKNNARIIAKPDMSTNTVEPLKTPIRPLKSDISATFKAETKKVDMEIAILKAFNKWRYISNEIIMTIN